MRFWSAPRRAWRRSLPFRVVVTTLVASVIILSATGWFLLDQSTRGVMAGKTQSSVAEATSVVTSMRTQLSAVDLRTTSINEEVRRLAQDAAVSGQVGNQYYVMVDTPVALIGTAGVAQSSIPGTLRSAMSDADGFWSTPTSIHYTDGRADEPGLVVAAQLTQSGGTEYPIFFIFPTTEERATLAVVQQATLATGAFLLVGLGVTVYLIAMIVLRPVRAARLAAESLAAGQLDDRMRVVGTDDLASLATSMNHMAEELDKKITQLQDLSQMQQRFVSDVSHELRTPMTTIRMATEMLHANRGTFDAPTARASELLSAEVDRFEHLLAELLEISRFDAGAAELMVDDVDLGQVVAAEVEAARVLAADSGSVLTLAVDGPTTAEVDERRIRRILRNLLTNAVEHGEGRPVDVQVRGDQDAVAVSVRDHGVGLDDDEAQHVFERFWRGDPARTRRVGGTGLGLSIALEDARLHGGWLDVAPCSEGEVRGQTADDQARDGDADAFGDGGHGHGQGACFRLTVPRRVGGELGGSPLPFADGCAGEESHA